MAFVVFMERALRKIHIQYPRRQVGMKIYDGQSSHLPIKVNPAGVIPAIFASSLLLLPVTISTFSGNQTGPVMSTILAYFGPRPAALPAVLHGDDCLRLFLHVQRQLQTLTTWPRTLKEIRAAFIPGIRPGKKTEDYLTYVVNRVLVIGSDLSGGRLSVARGDPQPTGDPRSTSAAPRC